MRIVFGFGDASMHYSFNQNKKYHQHNKKIKVSPMKEKEKEKKLNYKEFTSIDHRFFKIKGLTPTDCILMSYIIGIISIHYKINTYHSNKHKPFHVKLKTEKIAEIFGISSSKYRDFLSKMNDLNLIRSFIGMDSKGEKIPHILFNFIQLKELIGENVVKYSTEELTETLNNFRYNSKKEKEDINTIPNPNIEENVGDLKPLNKEVEPTSIQEGKMPIMEEKSDKTVEDIHRDDLIDEKVKELFNLTISDEFKWKWNHYLSDMYYEHGGKLLTKIPPEELEKIEVDCGEGYRTLKTWLRNN